MPVVEEQNAPCNVESVLWRECLKTFDYSPERPKSACETQRGQYYKCIKQWKQRTTGTPYDPSTFYLNPKCSNESEKLHQCMMMSMFEVSGCQGPMLALKACGYENDPSIREALSEDADVLRAVEDRRRKGSRGGLSKLWDKMLGKE